LPTYPTAGNAGPARAVLESRMKTIRAFVFGLIPVVCAACATQQPRTISAFPDPPTVRDLQLLQRLPNGNYLGYQRIVVNGQEQFCRQSVRNWLSDGRVFCLTEAELRTDHLLALEQAQTAPQPSAADGGQPMIANIPSSR
jgi:hypothetical protein